MGAVWIKADIDRLINLAFMCSVIWLRNPETGELVAADVLLAPGATVVRLNGQYAADLFTMFGPPTDGRVIPAGVMPVGRA